MSTFAETSAALDGVRDEDAPSRGTLALAIVDIAWAVWLLALLGLGLAARAEVAGPLKEYTDYSNAGFWNEVVTAMHGPLELTGLVGAFMMPIALIGSIIALFMDRASKQTLRLLLAGTIALPLVAVTLVVLGMDGRLLWS